MVRLASVSLSFGRTETTKARMDPVAPMSASPFTGGVRQPFPLHLNSAGCCSHQHLLLRDLQIVYM